ncbi:uncharacterized protein YciW [Trinickia symbiotica]|uniref:CMD domain protein n=1 Tax=Trinickia symbiotica TaxID=863227 RepID=A0A2N7WRX2_9BURK|nr:hypothetical protein [Trinickia symbiotica]PMS32213.1 hypothetical protein C0Z20_26530 [Trinickia symbiotica]PPK45234.1 uncharacterized protein YciW [Trinickia symbiotica]
MSTAVNEPFADGDFVSKLAGLAPAGTVAALRAARADAKRFTQGSHDALFDPNATGLSLEERLAAATYAAHLAAAPDVTRAYRERLIALRTAARDETLALLEQFIAADNVSTAHTTPATDATKNARTTAILSHTHALATLAPLPGKPALVRLKEAGLATHEIVALSQLVAFVTYQVRVVAALRALEAAA